MILWILKHPATIAFFLLFVAAAGSSALARHEMKRANALESQLKESVQTIIRMQADQKAIEGISHDYQNRITALNRALAAKRLRPSKCVLPSTIAASGNNGIPGHGEPLGPDAGGISTDWLDDYAAEAEHYRLQLIACQDYVRKVLK